jgi:ABC-type multidrug transport system fused ATPase/permease subunit
MTAAGAAFDLLDTPAPTRRIHQVLPDLRTAPIELDRVTVRYPGRDDPAVEDLSMIIEPGRQLALTGPSGTGKSTLIGLLLGLVTPTSGRVLVGSIDLAELDPQLWWGQVAWVPQRPHLFAGSVADNVRLGRPDSTDAQVAAALRLACAEDFVAELPTGVDTLLGEHGTRLSTGQRQRIALARAFLRTDAPLVLLDEPSAGLDLRTEARLTDSLRPALHGRTVVVAAHRPALVRGLALA